MKNVCIVVSNVDRAIAFEWTVEGLSDRQRFTFILIGKKGTYLANYLKEKNVPFYEVEYTGKRDAPKAVWNIFGILRKNRFDVIHTHLVEATLYAMLPAWLLRIKRRIYTRHHSDYNYKYSPKGIKYDKISNWLVTDVIAISGQVKKLLMEREHVPESKITLIPHGIDINYFEHFDPVKARLIAEKYNPGTRSPVIGIIARQTHWKGIQYIIPAFASLLKEYPDAYLVLANANGDYAGEIKRMLEEQLPANSFCQIKYEYDTASLYQLFDVYVHTPVDEVVEAFGQVYIEALAAAVPCVFTLSGIAVDCMEDRKNAMVVPHCDSEAVFQAIRTVLTDKELRETICKNGTQLVHERFSLELFLSRLNELYNK